MWRGVACNGSTSATRGRARTRRYRPARSSVRPTVAWPALDDRRRRRAPLALAERRPIATASSRARRSLAGARPRSERSEARRADARRRGRVLRAHRPTVDGATISLQGTRAAHRYEGIEPADRQSRASRRHKGFVSVNEGIRTASWMENGAAYSVDVECSDLRNDARCQSDDFVLAVVAQLTYVGGSGR